MGLKSDFKFYIDHINFSILLLLKVYVIIVFSEVANWEMPWARRSSEPIKLPSKQIVKCDFNEDYDDNVSNYSDESVCYYLFCLTLMYNKNY